MRTSSVLSAITAAGSILVGCEAGPSPNAPSYGGGYGGGYGGYGGHGGGYGHGGHGSAPKKIKPKVFIIDMFSYEANVWYGIPEFNVLEKNYSIPGFSPIYPDAHCTAKGDICQLVTGESEINAASTISALVLNPLFDLTSTYFMVAGIAGINPEVATICSVTFAKYAVQVALQYEFDAREIPSNYSTGYIPLGAFAPYEYPTSIYGTEVFEVNEQLREIAIGYAKKAKLADNADAISYRAKYKKNKAYAAGAKAPSVVACDSATSDVYYSGALLSNAFANYTKLITNGSGEYCATAQEDNATLEAMVRAAKAKLVDFSRIILMRTASDFDRPPPGESPEFNLFYAEQGAFFPSLQNIYLAGREIIAGILTNWDSTFEKGIKPKNYIGDIFVTLGGNPDFGPYTFDDNPVTKRKRSLMNSKRAVVVPS